MHMNCVNLINLNIGLNFTKAEGLTIKPIGMSGRTEIIAEERQDF